MVPRSLQEDLLRIPGVEGAEVEGTGDQPAGLRIRIAAGADQGSVGAAIRRVLTEHGLGTDTRLPGEDAAAPEADTVEPVTPDVEAEAETAREPAAEAETASSVAVLEDPRADVIDLTDDGDADAETEDSDLVQAQPPDGSPAAAAVETDDVLDAPAEPDAVEPIVEMPEPRVDDVPPEPVPPLIRERIASEAVTPESGFARIESVSVEEGRDGILVTVTSSDGETVAQLASSSEGGLDTAIVKATSRLALPEAPDPVIVEIEERRIEGVDIVMLVLDTDGHIVAGSSIVVAGRAFAVGRAAWSALTS